MHYAHTGSIEIANSADRIPGEDDFMLLNRRNVPAKLCNLVDGIPRTAPLEREA